MNPCSYRERECEEENRKGREVEKQTEALHVEIVFVEEAHCPKASIRLIGPNASKYGGPLIFNL